MNLDDLPWLKPLLSRLTEQLNGNTLPHALLISGPASIGKNLLVDYLISRLLCASENQACGECHQCNLLKAGTHPDYLRIALKDSNQILVDQIRGMFDWVSQTSQQGGQRICVISPADCMNVQAANSLLKSLEEPPEAAVIILVSNFPNRLLPTIRSRCQHIVCRTPDRKQAIEWLRQYDQSGIEPELLLNIADGVPMRASVIIDDSYFALRGRIAETLPLALSDRISPIQMAASLSKDDPAVVLDIIYQLTADTLCFSLSGNSFRNYDLSDYLEKLVLQIEVDHRFDFLNRLCRARSLLASHSNANTEMLLEWLLVG